MSDKVSVLRGPKDILGKTRNALRTMTTGTAVLTLPKGSRILYYLVEGVATNTSGTGTLSIGTNSASSNQHVNAYDVKTAATGVGPTIAPMVSGILGTVLTADTTIFFKYAESVADSTVGNWKVTCVFTTGNVVNDTTI